MATTTFKSSELFGGAIVVDIPSGFVDVSTIRQVPDNQEVYLDKNGFTSITFDLTERVDAVANSAEALKYHLDDIIEPGDRSRSWSSKRAEMPKLPSNTPAYTLLGSQHPASATPARRPEADFTGILLTLVRLEAQKTDIVITVNVPHVAGEYVPGSVDLEGEKLGKQLDAAVLYRDRILETFEIRDWGLFV